MSYLTLKNVSKTYTTSSFKVEALKNISFEADEGQFIVILGQSGAGKTTLLNLLGGMDNVTSGDIFLDEKEVSKLNKSGLTKYRRTDIGFVFQFYNLVSNLTAKENVELASEITEGARDASEVLKEVGLEERMNNFPSQLSGGEQQRVSIARALAKNPKMLLCDEPTGALDFETGKKILSLLYNLSKEQHRLVIVVTHNQALKDMADKVIYIRSGEILKIEENDNPKKVEDLLW